MVYRLAGGPEFNRPDKSIARQRQRNDEIMINVLTVGRESVGFRNCHHEVGGTQFPSIIPLVIRRKLHRPAFLKPFAHPLLNQSDLIHRQPTLILKVPKSGFRRPRRHISSLHDVHNGLRLFPDIGIGHEIEWSRLILAMASGAVLEDNGRNILRKPHRVPGARRVTNNKLCFFSRQFQGRQDDQDGDEMEAADHNSNDVTGRRTTESTIAKTSGLDPFQGLP